MPLSLYSLIVMMGLLSHAALGFAPDRQIRAVTRTMTTTRLFSGSGADDDGVTPLDQVVRLRGKVDEGYGRGGKKLGFPTANLPSSLFQNALEQVPTGVYVGWALIEGESCSGNGRGIPQKAAVNVGYSPTFEGKENTEKIVEAHLILEEGESTIPDFYHEVMRLSLVGFLRPEKKFDSFPDLMAAITNDVETAKRILSDDDESPYVAFKMGSFLLDNDKPWIGKDGGDADASWEFQDWNEAVGE